MSSNSQGSKSTEASGKRTAYRTCPLCEATCGVAIEIEDNRVVRVRGDKDDPFSRGYICPKGSTLGELHEDPDRLRTPMVRRNGQLEPATWDEAFEAIERGLMPLLEKHGRSALAMLAGNPTTHHLVPSLYIRPLILSAGTRNLFTASTVDQMPQHVVSGLLWGDPNAFPIPDIDRTDYLLMLGANPMASNGSLMTAPDLPGRIKAMPARGAKLVVVDPRRSETADRADEHLFIRPGTDVYWLAALVNTLFAADLVSIGRLESFVSGVEDVRALVLEFTPESVAEICGIDAETTRRIAHELAGAAAGAVYGRMGAHTVEFGTATAWMTAVLNVLTGNFDRPGGVMTSSPVTAPINPRKPGGRGFRMGRWKSRVHAFPEVNGEFPAAGLAEEMETPGEGQIRAAITIATNPVRSYPNSERLERAFAKLDYLVAIDIYVNETTRHADVILPSPSPLEEEHYDLTFNANAIRSVAKYAKPTFPNSGPSEEELYARLILILRGEGAHADTNIVHQGEIDELLERLLKDPSSAIAGRGRDEILAALEGHSAAGKLLDLRLRTGWHGDGFGSNPGGLSLSKLAEQPHGVDLGPMVERFPSRLKTESGTLEMASPPLVADWARVQAGFGQATGNASSEGLLLVGRRHLRSNNSWMHNIGTLVKGKSRCTLLIHPEDAEKRGLTDGAISTIRSKTGELSVAVETSDSMMPGVVCLPHGWGHDVEGVEMDVARANGGVPSNVLTGDVGIDTISGNAILNGIPVEVHAA